MFSSTVYLASLLVTLISASYVGHVYGKTDCNKLNPFDVSKENIRLSKGRLPIRINLSGNVYGNEDPIKVNIGGTLNSRFSIQIISIDTNQRVGRFHTWPNSILQPLFCKRSNESILATTQPLNSSDVSFYWQSPHSDKGTLALMGTFIKDDEYWILKKDGPKLFYHLPRRKKEIPMNLLCYDADVHCLERECGYEINYKLVDSQKLKIYFEAVNVKHHVSVAIAVTRSNEQEMGDSIIVTCTLDPEIGVKINSYLSTKEKKLISNPLVDVDGNLFTCDLLVSLEDLKRKGGAPLKYANFWGQMEQNNGQLNLPKGKHKQLANLFRPLLKEDAINVSCHTPLSQSELGQAIALSNIKSLTICAAFMIICLSLYC